MNIDELARIISAEGHNLLSESVPVPKSTIFAVVGCPNPMPEELLLKIRLLTKKGVTVAFLRDDADLAALQMNVEVLLVDSIPVPELSDFDIIEKEFVPRKQLVINPELIINQPEHFHLIPRNPRIPANCSRSIRNLGFQRKILRRWIGSKFWTDFFYKVPRNLTKKYFWLLYMYIINIYFLRNFLLYEKSNRKNKNRFMMNDEKVMNLF